MTGTWLTIYANSTQHDTHREKDTQPETIKIDMKKYECNFECDDFILHFAQWKRKLFANFNDENYYHDNTSIALIPYQHFEH